MVQVLRVFKVLRVCLGCLGSFRVFSVGFQGRVLIVGLAGQKRPEILTPCRKKKFKTAEKLKFGQK